MNRLEDPVSRIVDAVAAAAGVEPVTREPPLAEVVDPDTLETVVEESTAAALEIRFAYRGHDVVVDGSGRVQVN